MHEEQPMQQTNQKHKYKKRVDKWHTSITQEQTKQNKNETQ